MNSTILSIFVAIAILVTIFYPAIIILEYFLNSRYKSIVDFMYKKKYIADIITFIMIVVSVAMSIFALQLKGY